MQEIRRAFHGADDGNATVVDIEARARLSRVRNVCEQERQALESLRDPRLTGVLQAISTLQAELAAALASLHAADPDGDVGD
jgi:hypothetical protein